MQIHFERSGGFAGITLTRTVSTDNLSAEQRRELMALIEGARFFDLPAVIRSSEPGADRFQYRISIQGDEKKHEIEVDEAAMPPQLKPLVAWLQSAPRH